MYKNDALIHVAALGSFLKSHSPGSKGGMLLPGIFLIWVPVAEGGNSLNKLAVSWGLLVLLGRPLRNPSSQTST